MATTFPTYPATTFEQAVELSIFASNQLHNVINGDATTTIETESGDIPSVRKALVDNFFFKTPIRWTNGGSSTLFNQLYYFYEDEVVNGWYYAPSATTDNPVSLGSTPVGDDNWVLYTPVSRSTPSEVYPWYVEITQEQTSVSPPYTFDTAIVVYNGIVLTATKDYTITDSVINFTSPLEIEPDAEHPDILFCYLGKVEEGDPDTNYVTYNSLASSGGATIIGTSSGKTLQTELNKIEDKIYQTVSLLDFESDDPNDDTSRMTKALATGADAIFIPSIVENGGKSFVIGDIVIPRTVRIYGVGGQASTPSGSSIVKLSTAQFIFHFDGTVVDPTNHPTGGGLFDIRLGGQVATDSGDLIKVTAWSFFKADNVGFNNLQGYGLTLKYVMESSITGCLFRRLGTNDKGAILLDDPYQSNLNNVNNLHIENNTFGLNSGAWIRATDTSFTDLIWINNNKFEYDDAPSSVNTSPQFVLNLGSIGRAFIQNNGFTHFKIENKNAYAGILRISSNATATQIFTNNQLFGCNGLVWKMEGGSILARDNVSNQANASSPLTYSITSNRHQDIEEISQFQSNGNLIRTSFKKSKFISSHRLGGSNNNTFVTDVGSYFQTAMSVAPNNVNIRSTTLPSEMLDNPLVLNVYIRVKCVNDSGSNGTIRVTMGSGSSINHDSTVIAANGWQTILVTIKPTEIAYSPVLNIINTGTVQLLFDGFYYEKADYIDWNFSFTPGTITASGLYISALQSTTDFLGVSNIVAGYGMPSFDKRSSGLLCSVNSESDTRSGNFTVTLFNPTSASVVTSISRCYIRIFLN